MAVTTTPTSTEILKWRRSFWMEYQRDNLFADYMGNDPTSPIVRINDLKDEGEQITIPILGRLSGQGQVGANTLVGNEEGLDQYGYKLTIDWARHAILLNKKEMRKSAADQLETVRPLLTEWAATKLRDDIIKAIASINVAGSTPALIGNVQGIPFASASAAQLNAWLTGNADRVQFGNGANTLVAGNFAASLANVDTTNDLCSVAAMNRVKRIAKGADPHIKPVRVDGGREYFVTFLPSPLFNDLSNDPAMLNANSNARAREGNGMDKNPLFQDGDLQLKGMLYREIPEMGPLFRFTGAGTAGANVYGAVTVGRSAIGYAVGQLPAPTTRSDDDYGFLKGRGVECCYGVGKVVKQRNSASSTGVAAGTNADWGCITSFFATQSDN